jgi:hypothetical protein
MKMPLFRHTAIAVSLSAGACCPFASRSKIASASPSSAVLRPREGARCKPMPAAAGRRHEGREKRGSGHGDHHGQRIRFSL